MSDTKDDDSNQDKKNPPPSKVVVTYSAEQKKKNDIPSEILPSTPAKVVSNPIDSGGNPAKLATSAPHDGPPKSRLHSKIPEEIAPAHVPFKTPLQAESSYKEGPASSFETKKGRDDIPPSPPFQGGEMPPPPPPSGSATGSLSLFLSIMTMVAVGALIFYTYVSQKNISELQSQSRDEQASVQSLLHKAQQSLARVDTLQQESQAQQKAFVALKTDLQNAQMRLVSLSGSKDWVLSEVNYLVFMANERLRIARDVPTAITQLQAAEEKITMLGDPALWGLKEALAKDIAKLGAQPRVKKQILWEQLNALQPVIAKAPFKTLGNETIRQNRSQNAPIDPNLPGWKKGLWHSWYEFKSLIRITKEAENPIPQALSLQEKAEVIRTMQLMSEQAQWAVLQGESKIYLASLQSLEKWTQDYLAKSPEQQTLFEQIAELKSQAVDSPLADISGTLQALSSIR